MNELERLRELNRQLLEALERLCSKEKAPTHADWQNALAVIQKARDGQ